MRPQPIPRGINRCAAAIELTTILKQAALMFLVILAVSVIVIMAIMAMMAMMATMAVMAVMAIIDVIVGVNQCLKC